ncbi:MAG: heparinase II/III family protein, partial [Oscillospiraceae bacterium]|nr:heparinase II/III family protein [Oscillospiraceae bacterium]
MIRRLISVLLLCGLLISLMPVSGAERGVSLETDAEFFGKLNLNIKGLEQVKSAVGKGDYTTAKKQLLSYYKGKFADLEASSATGATDSRLFMAMNDVWCFSEEYLSGVEVTATDYSPYTLGLGSDLSGIYILDQIYATVDGVAITTSESSTPPQLELYASNGVLLKTLTAIEDTSVRPGKDLSMNYGGMNVMYAKHWPDTAKGLPYSGATMRAYVRFNAAEIPSDARTAKLKVYAKRSPGNPDRVLVEESLYLAVFQCYCTNWSENSLTWDSLIKGNAVGHYSYNGLAGGFDWKKPAGTPSEWLNYNTRFYECRGLTLRGSETEDQTLRDSYMRKAKELVLDFVADGGENTPANRALEPANRLIEFPSIYKQLVTGGYLTPDENVRILSWLYDDTTAQYQGAYTLFTGANATPKSNLPYTNWGLWHLTGFYSALSYFPEFADAPSWKKVYDARLAVTMNGIIKEDGSYNEVTFGYPGAVISWCSALKKIMDQFGDTSGNAALFSRKMMQLTKYLVDCSLPNGRLPYWGDGGPVAALSPVNTTLSSLTNRERQEELAMYLEYYQNRAKGLPMDTMAQYDGIQVVTDRTGWRTADSMIFMNAKCAGSHSHRDALALLLYYGGRSLLTDTGTTSYDGGHPHFPFQRNATHSHNTIEMDGISQTLGNMVDDGKNMGDIQITGNDSFSAITSWSTASNKSKSAYQVVGTKSTAVYHKTNFNHSRDVSFLKELGSILVVTDKVVPEDTGIHSYTQNWHSAPYANSSIKKDSYLTGSTAYSNGANLIIAQAAGSDPMTATIETGYDATAPATPTGYFQYKQEKAGTITYQTLLYPVPGGASATVQPRKLPMANTTDSQALAMEATIADSSKPNLGKLTHYHSFEDTPVERSFGSYRTNALTAVAAASPEGKLNYAALVGGNTLTADGEILLRSSEALTELSASLENGVLSLYSRDPKAEGTVYELYFSGQKVEKAFLNGEEVAFTQDSDGRILVKAAYVLLDFNRGEMASRTAQWDGLRVTAEVDQGKGILFGTISGGDPNARMNTKAENLGYTIKAGDIIELRMKTTLSVGEATGVQVFFRDRNTAGYSEGYSCKNLTLDHATGRYQTIVLPFLTGAEYIGKTIDALRLDMLHLGSEDQITGVYEVDYIYLGPVENAPSQKAKTAQYLYFNFSNLTKDRERYAQEAYGGYPFDLECWWYNYNRTDRPVIENDTGTLSFHIKDNNAFSYVQTSDFSNSLTAKPLYYIPHPENQVQVRLRFEHCAPTTENPRISLFYIRDDMEDVTNDNSYGCMTEEAVLSGEYVVVSFPVSELFGNAECINSIRLTISDLTDDGTGLSKVIIDYIYVGPEESFPIGDRLYFGFDNSEEAGERYGRKTYGGHNFDQGFWGVNPIRAEDPVIKEEALCIGIPQGSSGPYTQTTTGGNALSTMPLTYFPGEEDLVQLRVKFRNCIGSRPNIHLYYIKDDSSTV